MSTRSVTLLYSEFVERDWRSGDVVSSTVPLARWYRHCDGYPEANGLDICKALAMADAEDDVNNRNWAQHFLKRYMAMGIDVELEQPAGDGQFSHGDLEYVYRLTGRQDYTDGKVGSDGEMENVVLEVFGVNWELNLKDDYSNLGDAEPLFRGTWREFPRWLGSYCDGASPLDSPYGESNWACDGASKEVWNGLALLARG